MKIKNAALNLVVYFLYFFGSCVLVMFAESLLISVLEKFVALPYPVQTVIRIVVYTAGVPAILGILGHAEGYREAECSIPDTVVGGILGAILHLIFAMLFKFEGFVSGVVRFTAGLIHNGWAISYESLIEETPYVLFLLIFLLYSAIYIGVLTITKYLGAQKRLIDRADLRKGESTDDNPTT